MNSLVYGAVARQSAHELSHDEVVDEWCIATEKLIPIHSVEKTTSQSLWPRIHSLIKPREARFQETSWFFFAASAAKF